MTARAAARRTSTSGSRKCVAPELAGGVHRRRAHRRVAIVGRRAQRRHRRLLAPAARQLHGRAQRHVRVLAAAERDELRADGVAAEPHQRAERGQPHAERRIVERLGDVGERAAIAQERQARERLTAHAGILVVQELRQKRARVVRLPLRDRGRYARPHAHIAIGGERGEARLAVAEPADGVDGDDLGFGVVAVEHGAQYLGRHRHLV
jgi:hypothetical protein